MAAYFPDETKDSLLSEWYYSDFDRCPHDAWVESLQIFEYGSGDRKQNREVRIRLKLLAASHAGHIQSEYKDVSWYRFEGEVIRKGGAKHEDWLSDEITLASDGQIDHEILFSSATSWRIRCRSVAYNYAPLPGAKQGAPWAG